VTAVQADQERSATRRVLTGSSWIVISQGLTFLLVFLAQRIILSTLSKEDNGTLFFVRRITDIVVVILADFGLNGIIIRRAVQEPDRLPAIVSSAAAFRLVMWTVATAIAAASATMAGYSAMDVIIWSCFVLMASRTTLLRYVFEVPLRTTSRFGLVSALGILDVVLFALIVWLRRHDLTPTSVISAFLLAAIPGMLVMLLLDRGRNIHPRFVEVKEIRNLLREAMPVIVAVGLVLLHQNIDSLILEAYGTARDMGTLGAVYAAVGQMVAFIPVGVSYAAMPEVARFSENQTAERALVIRDVLRGMIMVGVLMAAVIGPVMPFFVDLVSKGRYADDVWSFYLMIWTAPGVAVLVFAQELAVTMRRRGQLLLIAGVLVGATLCFGLALIPPMHAEGAVIARLATTIVAAGVSFMVMRSIVGQALDLLFVLRCVVAVSLSAAITTYAAMNVGSVSGSLMAVVGTIVAGVALGLVRVDDVRRLAGVLRR